MLCTVFRMLDNTDWLSYRDLFVPQVDLVPAGKADRTPICLPVVPWQIIASFARSSRVIIFAWIFILLASAYTTTMPHPVLRLLDAEKRIIRMQSHHEFLLRCKDHGFYPEGLSVRKTPSVNMNLFSSQFADSWNNTLSAASLALTDHLIVHFNHAIREAEVVREHLVNDYIDSFGLAEYMRTSQDLQMSLRSYRHKLDYAKKHKFSKLITSKKTVHSSESRDWWSASSGGYAIATDPELIDTENLGDASSESSGLVTGSDSICFNTVDRVGFLADSGQGSFIVPHTASEVDIDPGSSSSSQDSAANLAAPLSPPLMESNYAAASCTPLTKSSSPAPHAVDVFSGPKATTATPTSPSVSPSLVLLNNPSPDSAPSETLFQESHSVAGVGPYEVAKQPGFLAPFREPVKLRTDEYSSVIILSSCFTPSKSHLSVLSKGINFCPVPRQVDELEVRLDLERWKRKVRLAEFFADKPEKEWVKEPFKPPSTWNPPRGSRYTEDYLKVVENEVLTHLHSGPNFHNNLTHLERQAIRELKENRNIVIKGADKGSGVVVMDTDRYIKEGHRQLDDTSTYRKLDIDPSPKLESELRKLVNQAAENGTITTDMANYAIPPAYKLARFYLLPKVHKVGVPGRPVVSCSGSLTEKVSEIVDHLIKPFLPTIPSYLKDTKDFLSKVRNMGPLPDNAILVSLDVVNLYPSIPHADGLLALSEFLSKQGMPSTAVNDIIALAKFVLTNNVFEFNSEIFLQISGTAIGTKMAPSYAVIFMHMLETKVLSTSLYRPLVWYRFIDDIYSIWLHGEERLLQFIDAFNAHHPSIKLTHDYSDSEVDFLDVKTRLQNSIITTDLYIKPTDTHQYLHPASCHPGHIKSSIPFSQTLRILRICSERSTADRHIANLVQHLVKRGHSKKKVLKQVNRAKREFDTPVQRESTTTTSQAQDSSAVSHKPRRIPLVLTYHPGLPDISAITRRFLPMLHLNSSMKEICPEPPLIAFRRPPNLANSLIRAKLASGNQKLFSCGPCSAKGPKRGPKCAICTLLPIQTHVTSTSTQRTHRLKLCKSLDCDSVFVVYLITCSVCSSNNQYVGQTSNLRKRTNNHKSCIRTGRYNRDDDCTRLYEHFKKPKHSPESFTLTILEQCLDKKSLLEAETKWIWELKTVNPFGLNLNDGFVNH